jgi:hypothetical protein
MLVPVLEVEEKSNACKAKGQGGRERGNCIGRMEDLEKVWSECAYTRVNKEAADA